MSCTNNKVTELVKQIISSNNVITGNPAKKNDQLEIHYTGTFCNGKVFDSSISKGKPFTFTLGIGQVIKGWDQGLVGVQKGGKYRLTIPPNLAYGDRGIGPIPANSTLIFEVEVLKITYI